MKRKKIFSIVMVLVLSLCSFPLIEVQAQEAFPEGETLETDGMEDFKNPTQEVTPQAGKVRAADNIWEEYRYRELEDGTLEITGYKGKDSELVIPSEINEKRVTSIGKNAFWGCSGLTQISIPESVTSLGGWAFNGCSGLTEIIVDSNNPAYASQNGILYDKKREQLMYCPVGKKGKISIPEGVTSIEGVAFAGCSGLTQISIPESVTSIGGWAFRGCSGLTQIRIPAGVTNIEEGAFLCNSLLNTNFTEIIVDSNNPAYASQNGILYDKKREQLMYCPVGKKGKISIPEGVTSIKNWAFENCYKLTEISIPKSVTKIETYGFYGADQNATLLVYKGSYADTYAKKSNFKYKYISCSHTWRETATAKATVKKNGSITKTCTTCGEQSTETIYAAKAITLSKASYVYNGKNQKPSIIVKDSKGKTLKNKTDYTVTYPKNGKNVGIYTVTVKLKGKYSGTVKKTFQILPKGTTISKITPKKKGFMVQWKKQAAQTTGYEIAYSTNKNFTKKTTETAVIGGNKTVSKSVSKQRAGKKYFVKIRTYKALKVNGKSKKLYSSWSKVKTVTTKR